MPFLPMIFKMIMTRYALHCVGFVVLLIAGVVGIAFALDGWQAFFASVAFLFLTLAVTVFAVVKMVKGFIKKQQEGMANMLQSMVSGNVGAGGDNGFNPQALMSMMGAIAGAGGIALNNGMKQIEAGNIIDIPAVELDSAGNPLPANVLGNTMNPFAMMYADDAGDSLPDMTNMTDAEVIVIMKGRMTEEEFTEFETLTADDKKEVIEAFKSDDGELFGTDMMEQLMGEMSPEDKLKAQEMITQMMGMFGNMMGGTNFAELANPKDEAEKPNVDTPVEVDNSLFINSHQQSNESLIKSLETHISTRQNAEVIVESVVAVQEEIANDAVSVKVATLGVEQNILKPSSDVVEFDLEKMQGMLSGKIPSTEPNKD